MCQLIGGHGWQCVHKPQLKTDKNCCRDPSSSLSQVLTQVAHARA